MLSRFFRNEDFCPTPDQIEAFMKGMLRYPPQIHNRSEEVGMDVYSSVASISHPAMVHAVLESVFHDAEEEIWARYERDGVKNPNWTLYTRGDAYTKEDRVLDMSFSRLTDIMRGVERGATESGDTSTAAVVAKLIKEYEDS